MVGGGVGGGREVRDEEEMRGEKKEVSGCEAMKQSLNFGETGALIAGPAVPFPCYTVTRRCLPCHRRQEGEPCLVRPYRRTLR